VNPEVRSESLRRQTFDVRTFLRSTDRGTTEALYRKGEAAFSQGDPASDVRYIEAGSIRLSVLSSGGKEAVVSTLGPGEFFGEGALAGQARRIETAIAVAVTSALVIEKDTMIRLLHDDRTFSDRFISHMLKRNMRIEADLVDQLFNSSEKRLARALLLLARYGQANPARTLPRVSQETLAEMIGTTRSRVNVFMNKFRKLGLIEYTTDRDVTVHDSLINIILHD
jgi:CRP/FNR family transcriptional regulator, cyclic AMP receptor protein